MDTNKQEWKEKFLEEMPPCRNAIGADITGAYIIWIDFNIVSPLESSIKEKDKEIERLRGNIHNWLGRLDLLDWNNYLERVIDEMREELEH